MSLTAPLTPPATSFPRSALYGMLNIGFVLSMCVAAAVGSDPNPRLLYLGMLFALCSTPVLFVRKLNDRYALYTMFLFIYFVSYGVMDVLALLGLAQPDPDPRALSPAEGVILLGGAAFILGYRMSATRVQRGNTPAFAADDWPLSTLLTIGVLLWGFGIFATWYWNTRLTIRSLQMVGGTSEITMTMLMIGRYVEPLGILILAYLYTIARTKFYSVLIVGVVVLQVALGFISNTKGGAMLGGILVILAAYLVRGKPPKAWLLAGSAFLVFAYPVFMAYRTVVVGEQGITNAQAEHHLGHVLQLAINGEKQLSGDNASSFFARASVKSAVELIVDRAGVDVPYAHGYTLIPLLTSLIPRLIWRDKLDVQTGLLFNQQFHIEQATVYISPSHLGELYWNFGWAGALIGMGLLGLAQGWINRRCDLSTGTSITRLLLLAVTIYQTGVRFEGSIASDYAIWIRSGIAILLMHWLFARRGLRRMESWHADATLAAPSQNVPEKTVPAFPNLMS